MGGGAPLAGRPRRLVFGLLRMSGIPLVLRATIQRRRLTILLFHQQSADLFERTARALKRRYNLVTLSQALDALASGTLASLPVRPMLLTFDDGRASNADLIPLFTRYGIRPTVFVTTGIVGTNRHFWWTHLWPEDVSRLQYVPDDERVAFLREQGADPCEEHDQPQALSLDQLRALAQVADIQPHTRMHPLLTRCTPERVREEIAGSATDIEELLGLESRIFAYPNGAFSDTIAEAVRNAGMRFAVTTEPVLADATSDPLRLGRIFIRDTADESELVVFASGLQGILKRVLGHRS